jgi:hypothetical protein
MLLRRPHVEQLDAALDPFESSFEPPLPQDRVFVQQAHNLMFQD